MFEGEFGRSMSKAPLVSVVIPVYNGSDFLAAAIHSAIEQNLSGLINVPAKQKISKYNLLLKIKEIFNSPNIEIIPFEKKFEDKSLISERTDFDFEVKEYPEMLLDLFHFMNVNVELYEHYIQNR